MGCPGLHCSACSAGIAVPVVPFAAVFGLAWVGAHLIEVAAVSAACGILAVAAVIPLMRWAERRDARRLPLWIAREAPAAVTATVIPQVPSPVQPAIEHHHHGPVFNFYGPDGEATAARIIRQALPGGGHETA
jgi:hypothetical protein